MAKEIKERRMKSLNELFGESGEDRETESKVSQQNEIPDEYQNIQSNMAIIELPVNICRPYHNHKFKIKRGDYDGLVKSIMAHGVTNLIIVTPYHGEYEIIAGHRRHQASIDAGKTTIPAIVRELSDNEAWVIVSETNIQQSSLNDLSHSEKAEIISDYHSALKVQGKRTDLINEVRNLME